MKGNNVNKLSLAEAEYCLAKYFVGNIAPVMDKIKREFGEMQASEVKCHQMSFYGIMRTLSGSTNAAYVDNPLQDLRNLGGECSKSTEDYFDAIVLAISSDADMISDIRTLAAGWKNTIIEEVGEERYFQISETIGADLSAAYAGHRIEQMMAEKMVGEMKPDSLADYIVRKGFENSIFGVAEMLQRSPLEESLWNEADGLFNPSEKAKIGAKAMAIGADLSVMGGFSSWSALAKTLGFETAFAVVEYNALKNKPEDVGLTIDQCIEQAVWGKGTNALNNARSEYSNLNIVPTDSIRTINDVLNKKMSLDSYEWLGNASFSVPTAPQGWEIKSLEEMIEAKEEKEEKPRIPLVIAPGQEESYMEWVEEQERATKSDKDNYCSVSPGSNRVNSEEVEGRASPKADDGEETKPQENSAEEQPTQSDNSDLWSQMLRAFGLEGIGDIGRNLPYVLATLPDMLVGLLTGKTESVGLKKDLLPLASILLGLFIKNPLLKIALIGGGGANLINKMGHEAIDRQNAKEEAGAYYKRYNDEAVNPRITDLAVSGNLMVATIDGVPCRITLPDKAADAYARGCLPLGTLANAVLAKHDQAQALASERFAMAQGIGMDSQEKHHQIRI